MATPANRRQAVAQGGMFSTPKANFSRETQELLKMMMQESKLTNFQQRQLNQTLKSGQSLPLRCHPTSSRPDGQPVNRSKKSSSQKIKAPKQSGLRTKEMIEHLTVADKEPEYRPSPSRYNSTKEKQKLQNVMAFGSETEPAPAVARPQPLIPDDEGEVDRFEEVMKEIEERKEFLEEMEALGQGQKYRTKLITEISQKIHELELIDKERTLSLKK